MVRAVADRAFLPAKSPLRAGGGHDDPDREDDRLGDQAPVPLWRRVHRTVPLRSPALLVPDVDLDARRLLWRSGPAGSELPLVVRRPRPPRRVLRPRLDQGVRPQRYGRGGRRRRWHRDHRRPRLAQDPRGARRASGARRQPDQEPGRAPLSGADADHRPTRRLRADLRYCGRCPRRGDLQRAAWGLLRDPLQQRLGHRPVGVSAEVHAFRSDHRDRLLVQGDDRLGRCRGGWAAR